MKACLSCNTQISDDARFCPHCGRDQTVEVPPVSQPVPTRHTNTVESGMGYALGTCLFVILGTLGFIVLCGYAIASCAASG